MKKVLIALGFVLLTAQSAVAVLIKNEDDYGYALTMYPFFGTPVALNVGPKEEHLTECNKGCSIKVGEGSPISIGSTDVILLRGGTVTVIRPHP
ncbi:MAG TPA: hypothetical protein V6D14_11945 [Coleofasciculaceae cyanobacterium]|jgi:hypothetical protein